MEQHTPEPKSPSIFGKLGSWAKKATKKATTGLQQVGAGLVVGAKVAGKIGMKLAKFLVFDDVNTLFSKDASFLNRTIAAVSLVPVPIGKVLKVAKLGKLGFSANSAGKATRGSGAVSNVSKGTKGTDKISGTHRELTSQKVKDSHHIIQDAAVRDLPLYNRNDAPAIHLQGPNIKGTEHYIAGQIQRQPGGGTYAAERRIGYKAMRRAGVSEEQARREIERVDQYFSNIGVTPDTVTRIPGNRRR
ncbi:hypothetical protein [Virgibacillus sp. LDC-1]|uniref:hypothetical protein n=1 Tax=Virgibacillus sp. LDC-1 TaxID=3039856 RepID=UPI0024DE9460|nr:hypothetical protein [Virgibacillus sp. LDC-1]